jgi:fatty-acid desaturase
VAVHRRHHHHADDEQDPHSRRSGVSSGPTSVGC